MKFRIKATCCMITLISLFFGAGGSALISINFHTSLQQEKTTAQESYRMILNTMQIVNNMDEWTDEKDISKILEQLSAQDAFGAALQLHSQTETLYSKGKIAAHFKNLSGQTDVSHLACTIFSAPDTRYYLQLSGSFLSAERHIIWMPHMISLRFMKRAHSSRSCISRFLLYSF